MFSASKTSGPSGYNLTNSLRFRASASAYLNRTPASAGNRQIFTISVWVKRGTLGVDQKILSAYSADSDSGLFDLRFSSANVLYIGNWSTGLTTTAVFRDPSAWYHIVLAVDTTQATGSNRIKAYVNGTQYTLNGTAFVQNVTTPWNNNVAQNIGRNARASDTYFDGYMAEFYNIDGQALTPSSFGSTNTTTGVWQPARYSGTYGTNGFYLNFTDIALTSGSNAGLGKDFSGNGNYWNTNNISVTAGTTYDAMIDSPTLTSATVANYAVLNPVIPVVAGVTLSNGNLNVAYSSGSGSVGVLGTIGISSGKWYWEYTFTATNPNFYLGWRTPDGVIYFGVGCSTGNVLTETSSGSFSGSTVTVANGDVIGIAFDYAAGACYYYKNNTLFFTLTGFTTSSSTLFPIRSIWSSGGGASSGAVNFGQRPFAYTPPSGYLRLNTYNLPDSTIKKGNTVMDATLWTGDGNTTRTITNASSFRPDFVWMKERDIAIDHILYDSIRGPSTSSASKALCSNTTVAEGSQNDNSTYGYLNGFASSGFTVTRGSDGATSYTNKNNGTYVAWQWQAGQGTTSSNTQGSITSTVSVNATAGFSIVTWTGTGTAGTVGHGLGVAPKMVISKKRNGTSDWAFWITGFAGTELMEMNATSAKFTGATVWNSTTPTSTVFSVGSATQTNNSGGTYVGYLWAEIAGFSAFGSYTGNGSADGPFIYLGFRPKYVLIKRTDSSTNGNWSVLDSSVNSFNVATTILTPNTADAESNQNWLDLLSNGFKVRYNAANQQINTNGGTYIYAAFAENPFKNALAR